MNSAVFNNPAMNNSGASLKRASSRLVADTTSSRTIMMSDPIAFWYAIESSGLRSIMLPSCGLWKLTWVV